LVTEDYSWEEEPDKRRPLLMILEDGDGEEYRYTYDKPNFEPVITLIKHLEQYPELIDNKDKNPIEEVLFLIGNEIPPTKKHKPVEARNIAENDVEKNARRNSILEDIALKGVE
jgi:hypothetical protein